MRLKTLAGAPLCEHLDFGPETLLDPTHVEAFFRVRGHPQLGDVNSAASLKWRCLASGDSRLRSGWSQPFLPAGLLSGNHPGLSFSVPSIEDADVSIEGDTTVLDTTLSAEYARTQAQSFMERSLIFHDTLVSSQLAADAGVDRTVSSSSFLDASIATSFNTTTSDFPDSMIRTDKNLFPQLPSTLAITPLASLPTPQHLRAIHPQTPTPNLLCVLMAPTEIRSVHVKKGDYKMNLHEITVADDSKLAFKISFWSKPGSAGNKSQSALVTVLERAKVGDILLLRNVALNVFRDTVHGQSLNKSIARVKTSIDILMSAGGISSYQLGGLPASVVAAFLRVKRWASIHVASDVAASRKRKGRVDSNTMAKRPLTSPDVYDDTLPPDTLEPA